MKPVRIQLRRARGWRKPPNTVVVARPTRWGNPFRITAGLPAERAVALFREHWQRRLASDPAARAELRQLNGKNLACWCRPGQPCHGDVLLDLANPAPAEPE